jgi:high-affinity Fe2+/Pb2+ permease
MITFMLVYDCVCLISLIQETETDFNDLGKLLLGGVAAAIVLAVGFTFVRLRLRDRNPPSSNFISISAPDNNDELPG